MVGIFISMRWLICTQAVLLLEPPPRDVDKDPGFTCSPGCTNKIGVSWYLLRRGACVVALAEVAGAAEASAGAGASEQQQKRQQMQMRHHVTQKPSRMSKPASHNRVFISIR